MTYLIPTQNVATLQADIAKLAKKAAKLGCVAPVLTIGKTVSVKIGETAYGDIVYAQKVEVEVSGEAPKLNGWSFIGTVESVEGSTILRSVPGHQIPEQYRDADPCNCDHCKINRRRNSTFIVQSEAGEFKQVGRSCLCDFLGHANPEHVAAYAQHLVELDISDYDEDEKASYGASTHHAYNTAGVVAAAIRAIKLFGYRKTEFENNTRDAVSMHLFGKNESSRLPVEQEDRDQAVQAIEWMRQLSGSEFSLNVAAYAKCDSVGYKAFGYIAAATMMFLKSIDAVRAKESLKSSINNDTLGAEGDKISVRATVVTANTFSRAAYHYYDSGVSQVLMLKTESGNLIKMFSANMDIKVGDSVLVSGKIKECSKETYEKSQFFGCTVTQMAPRTRLTKQ